MANRTKERAWVRSHGPIVVFCLLTISGCAFIWVSKSLGWNAYYVTAAPIALMLSYFALALVADGLRLHDEQTGDNLYYMGFLFTLTSLGASLYQFTSSNSIDDIVRNFGIAITSTIAGIGLRIFYNQMRRDPLDVERATRHELANSARRIRAEMDAASQEFSVYRRTSNQMLQEGFEEITRQAQASGQQIQAVLEGLSRDAITPLQTASTNLHKIIDANSKAFDQLLKDELSQVKASAGALNNASESVVASIVELNKNVSSVAKKLRNIKAPEEVIKIEIEPILEKVASVAIDHIDELIKLSEQQRNEFAAVIQEVSVVGQVIPKIDRLLTLVERSVVAMEGQAQQRTSPPPLFPRPYPAEPTSPPPRVGTPWAPDRRQGRGEEDQSAPDTRRSIWPWQR